MEASRNVPQTRTSSSSPDLLLPPPPPSSALLHNPTSPLGREWFSSPIFPSSNPLLPLRGEVYPSPYPLPWTWRWGFARCQSVLFGPRWLQGASERSRWLLRYLKIAPHRFSSLTTCVQEPPAPPQDGPKSSRNLPRRPSRGQNPSKTIEKQLFLCLLAFSLPMGS